MALLQFLVPALLHASSYWPASFPTPDGGTCVCFVRKHSTERGHVGPRPDLYCRRAPAAGPMGKGRRFQAAADVAEHLGFRLLDNVLWFAREGRGNRKTLHRVFVDPTCRSSSGETRVADIALDTLEEFPRPVARNGLHWLPIRTPDGQLHLVAAGPPGTAVRAIPVREEPARYAASLVVDGALARVFYVERRALSVFDPGRTEFVQPDRYEVRLADVDLTAGRVARDRAVGTLPVEAGESYEVASLLARKSGDRFLVFVAYHFFATGDVRCLNGGIDLATWRPDGEAFEADRVVPPSADMASELDVAESAGGFALAWRVGNQEVRFLRTDAAGKPIGAPAKAGEGMNPTFASNGSALWLLWVSGDEVHRRKVGGDGLLAE